MSLCSSSPAKATDHATVLDTSSCDDATSETISEGSPALDSSQQDRRELQLQSPKRADPDEGISRYTRRGNLKKHVLFRSPLAQRFIKPSTSVTPTRRSGGARPKGSTQARSRVVSAPSIGSISSPTGNEDSNRPSTSSASGSASAISRRRVAKNPRRATSESLPSPASPPSPATIPQSPVQCCGWVVKKNRRCRISPAGLRTARTNADIQWYCNYHCKGLKIKVGDLKVEGKYPIFTQQDERI
jgi:hypothetical protein